MVETALNFQDENPIGKIVSVDASRVLISQTEDLVARAGVGNLVAIQGDTQSEFLIGMIERITRSPQDEVVDEEVAELYEDEVSIGASVADNIIRALLIGTYRATRGDMPDCFKRGMDSFPRIDRCCYCLEGENLQRFLELLGSGLSKEERLEVGHCTMA